MKNDDKRSEVPEPKTRTESAAAKDGSEEAPKKPRYEFKILPVDPKNSFDFEDVADK